MSSILNLLCPLLQLIHTWKFFCLCHWDEDRRVTEQGIHLLKRHAGCLGEEGPKDECITQVANDVKNIVVPANVDESDWGDLAYEC